MKIINVVQTRLTQTELQVPDDFPMDGDPGDALDEYGDSLSNAFWNDTVVTEQHIELIEQGEPDDPAPTSVTISWRTTVVEQHRIDVPLSEAVTASELIRGVARENEEYYDLTETLSWLTDSECQENLSDESIVDRTITSIERTAS